MHKFLTTKSSEIQNTRRHIQENAVYINSKPICFATPTAKMNLVIIQTVKWMAAEVNYWNSILRRA
jgi:hypothetical protein